MIRQSNRSLRLLTNIASMLNRVQKQNIRLRAPSSIPQTSAAVESSEARSSSIDVSEHATVFASAGRDSIIVCWHPPKPFPYEHTKPIERTEEELRQGDSPVRPDLMQQFKNGRVVFRGRNAWELQNMFYTARKEFEKEDLQLRIRETVEPKPKGRSGI